MTLSADPVGPAVQIGVVWKDGGAMLEVDVATSSIDALVVSCVALGAFADQAYPVAGTSLITVRVRRRHKPSTVA
jgi:hypothetical protein